MAQALKLLDTFWSKSVMDELPLHRTNRLRDGFNFSHNKQCQPSVCAVVTPRSLPRKEVHWKTTQRKKMLYLVAGFIFFDIVIQLPFWMPHVVLVRWRQILESRILNYFEGIIGLLVIFEMFLAGARYMKLQSGLLSNTAVIAEIQLCISGIMILLLIVLCRSTMLRIITLVEDFKKLRKHHAQLRKRLVCENNQHIEALEDAGRKTEMNIVRSQKGLRKALTEKSKKLSEQSKELERAKKDLAASEKQFAGLKQAYEKLLEERTTAQVIEEEEGKTETDLFKKQSKELEKAKKDLAALKQQATGLTREYDRLLEEYAKLQAEVKNCEGETREGKKCK